MSENTTCPTCGRDDFKSERGMKQHHARVHGESLTTKSETCNTCGDSFEYLPSERPNPQYCSDRCQGKGQRDRVMLTCNTCGDEYEKSRSREDRSNYCSKECADIGFERTKTLPCDNCGDPVTRRASNFRDTVVCGSKCYGELNSRKETHVCQECGDEFKTPPSREPKFCSVKCANDGKTGEKSTLWSGGSSGYYGSWESQKRQALERANYTCEHHDCQEDTQSLGQNPDVHHIVPKNVGVRGGYFDDQEEAHKLDNLIVLCREHHTGSDGIEPAKRTKVPMEAL